MNNNEKVVFSDLKIGDEFPEITVEITQEVIDVAALAHLDFNPVHTAVDWAERAQVFGTPKTVAHGMFTMSGMVSVVLRHWGKSGIAIVGIDGKLTRPVPVGSTVTTTGSIKELHPRSPGQDIVVVGVKAVDQDDNIVGVGSVRVRIRS
jgi:acyl dehydratase